MMLVPYMLLAQALLGGYAGILRLMDAHAHGQHAYVLLATTALQLLVMVPASGWWLYYAALNHRIRKLEDRVRSYRFLREELEPKIIRLNQHKQANEKMFAWLISLMIAPVVLPWWRLRKRLAARRLRTNM